MAEARKILPRASDVSRPYWNGCAEGELRLQQCDKCERFQFYPRLLCSHCGAQAMTWRRASGKGRIASFTVVRRGVSAAYDAPYVVALIDLEEGPRMMSQIVDIDPEDATLKIGAQVQVDFVVWEEEIKAPVFRLEI